MSLDFITELSSSSGRRWRVYSLIMGQLSRADAPCRSRGVAFFTENAALNDGGPVLYFPFLWDYAKQGKVGCATGWVPQQETFCSCLGWGRREHPCCKGPSASNLICDTPPDIGKGSQCNPSIKRQPSSQESSATKCPSSSIPFLTTKPLLPRSGPHEPNQPMLPKRSGALNRPHSSPAAKDSWGFWSIMIDAKFIRCFRDCPVPPGWLRDVERSSVGFSAPTGGLELNGLPDPFQTKPF